MCTILSYIDNYSNILSVILAFIAVAIAVSSYIYTKNAAKESLKMTIAEKEAELDAINQTYFSQLPSTVSIDEIDKVRVRKQCLEAQIRNLKKHL